MDYFQTLPGGIRVRLKRFWMLAQRAKIIQRLARGLKYPRNFLLTLPNLLQAQHRVSLKVNNKVSRFHNEISSCMTSQKVDTVNLFGTRNPGRRRSAEIVNPSIATTGSDWLTVDRAGTGPPRPWAP
jgi:hypothetical protein